MSHLLHLQGETYDNVFVHFKPSSRSWYRWVKKFLESIWWNCTQGGGGEVGDGDEAKDDGGAQGGGDEGGHGQGDGAQREDQQKAWEGCNKTLMVERKQNILCFLSTIKVTYTWMFSFKWILKIVFWKRNHVVDLWLITIWEIIDYKSIKIESGLNCSA